MADHKVNKQDTLVILIFAVLMALAWTTYSYYFPYQMGHDQLCLGTMIAKDLDPGLYPRDYAFKDDSLYRRYIPGFRGLMRGITRVTGSFENGLLALVPVVVLIYTLGMALLLLNLSGSRWAALLITFLSLPYRPAPGGEIWGVGGQEFILARTLATAAVPFLFILFFKLLEAASVAKGALLGFLTGLLAFLHPPTALFTGEILVGLLAISCWSEPRRWLLLGAMVLVYALTAFYPLTFMEQPVAAMGPPVSFAALSQVVQKILKIPKDWSIWSGALTARRSWLLLGAGLLLGLNYFLRPAAHRPRAALNAWLWGGLVVLYLGWRIAGKGAGLTWLYGLAAIYFYLRYRQRNPQPLDWWLLALGFLTLAISLIPTYAFTLLWLKLEFLPMTTLVVEHYRAVRLLHFFIYLLSARAAVYLGAQLAEWLQTSKRAIMTEYTLVALSLWNLGLFWVVQGGVILYETLRRFYRSSRAVRASLVVFSLLGLGGLLFTPSPLKKFAKDLGEKGLALRLPADHQEDAALNAWARSHTPPEALFYSDSAALRYRGQRSITHSQADLINYRDQRFVDFYRRYQEFDQAYDTAATLARKGRGADFIVVEKRRPVRLRFPIVFENDKYLVYQVGQKLSEPPTPEKP